jgi:CheY-like chemotaxis protein
MSGHSILLVDDDHDDRYLFSEALSTTGVPVDCKLAESGREALSLLQSEIAKLPKLIFLDVNMPEMNGWQVLEKLKSDRQLQNIPVIMYSTSSHSRDIALALEAGALCFCVKPDRFSDLQTLIREVCTSLDDVSRIAAAKIGFLHFTPPETGSA